MNKKKAVIVTAALSTMTALIILGLFLLHCYLVAGILVGLLSIAGFVFAAGEMVLWLTDDAPAKKMDPVTIEKTEPEKTDDALPMDFDTLYGEIANETV